MNLHGYLPADLYPLLKFYAAMGLVYLGVGIVWLSLMGWFFRDLLRVQLWISSVLLLGMLEMAVSFGDLDYLNKNGYRSQALMVRVVCRRSLLMGRRAANKILAAALMPIVFFLFPAQIFSKLLFASKNTLSRVMVLVVSMGYGITK
jgi:hypothetical protein